jgi:hypothetical protein
LKPCAFKLRVNRIERPTGVKGYARSRPGSFLMKCTSVWPVILVVLSGWQRISVWNVVAVFWFWFLVLGGFFWVVFFFGLGLQGG